MNLKNKLQNITFFNTLTLRLLMLCFVFSFLFVSKAKTQSFVKWQDDSVFLLPSGEPAISGTFLNQSVLATQTGGPGSGFLFFPEMGTVNLNGADSSHCFGTFGAGYLGPSKSLTFYFSVPVFINSFSVHDIDEGINWYDGFKFSNVSFVSHTSGGGVLVSNDSTTYTPSGPGVGAEYARWYTSTTAVSSFSLDFYTVPGNPGSIFTPGTPGLSTAYLGYSMEVSPAPTSLYINGLANACINDSILLTAVNDSVHAWALVSDPTTIISTDSAIWVSPIVATDYMVYGTADTAYHSVQVIYEIPDFNFGNDTTICSGQSILLDATSLHATDYQWQNYSTSPSLTVTQPGLYWATASNSCFTQSDSIQVSVINIVPPINLGPDKILCQGETHFLNATSPNGLSYLWQDGSTLNVQWVTTSGTYYAEVGNYCGSQSDTVNITFLDSIPDFSLGSDTTICSGTSITWDVTTNDATSYLWQDGSTNPVFSTSVAGVYSVQISNQCGSQTDTIVLSVQQMSVDLGPDQQICDGTSATLDAGNAGATYLWNDFSTNRTKTIVSEGFYFVEVSYGNCTVYDTIEISVQELFPTFSTPDLMGCEPYQMITGFIDSSHLNFGSISTWNWSFGNGRGSFIQNPSTTFQTHGKYSVALTITSDLGCVKTLVIPDYITVHPKAIADFSCGNNLGYIHQDNYFLNGSSYGNNYYWDFGDGHYSDEINPMHVYEEDGVFSINLFANNAFDCPGEITKYIQIKRIPLIYIPNSFTPDGDEYNAQWAFEITDIDLESFELMVYSRWGELVWETRDPKSSWDGTFNGQMVPDGTYTWILHYSDSKTAEKFIENGHVNLMR